MGGCGGPGDPNHEGSVAITGTVTRDGAPARAYIRLLNKDADFVAEVPAGADGGFTFYTVPGEWIVRAISSDGTKDHRLTIAGPEVPPLSITLG